MHYLKNGAFVAIENIIDSDRSQNVFGLTMSLKYADGNRVKDLILLSMILQNGL